MLRIPLLWIAALCAACVGPSGGAGPWRDWHSAHDRGHPLAGRILDVRARGEISPHELVARLASARFVLLGEKHDNPDHHRLQAWVIGRLAARGQQRAVAFEMLRLDHAPALARQLESAPADVDGIARAVDWERSGWPDWALYRPVFAAALAAGFPVVPADLAREELARLRSGGRAPGSLIALGVEQPLEAEALTSLESDLERAHCGMLPGGALGRMVAVQRARDAQLAAALADSAALDGALLIAGAGHVDRRWAVPDYLARAAPGATLAVLAFAELDPSHTALAELLDPAPPFDYVWLTPRVDDVDPCERFREELRKLRRSAPH